MPQAGMAQPAPPQPTARDTNSSPPELPMKGPSSRAILVFTVLLLFIAAGLGAYAWKLWNTQGDLRENNHQLEQARAKAETRVGRLETERVKNDARLAEANSELEELKTKLRVAEDRLETVQNAKAQADRNLSEFQGMKARFQRMIDTGTLDVTYRRGRMIVELPEGVLFASGSAELSEEGQEAVKSVARILRKVPRHRFLVGGHTDSVRAVKEYKSNWALSAARAVEVTESLIRAGLLPKRLVVAGYAQYDPVASNASESGRQKNRRIEIILEPYVEEPSTPGGK